MPPSRSSLPFHQRHSGTHAFAFVAVITLMAGLLVAWNAQHRITSFEQGQATIAEAAAKSAANEIELLIGEKRRLLRLFAGQYADEIAALTRAPDDEQLREDLEARVAAYFPQHFSVTIADQGGMPLLTDFEQRVGDVCLADIQTFARNDYLNDLFVHPNPEGYHFDIMAPWSTSGDVTGHPSDSQASAHGVFFVSFKLDEVARLLRHSEIARHTLLLVKRSDPALIEIAARGGRNQLQRDPRLTEQELASIRYRRPIPGTLWDVAVLPNLSALAAYKRDTQVEAGGIMALFLLVSTAMLYLIGQAEHQRSRAEQAQLQTNRQLQDTIKHLRETQEQLIASEKLAALGSLVKGVAHEINTPLGVGVTAASHLQDEVNALAAQLRHKQITRSQLAGFIDTAQMTNQMVVANLDRAVGLVQSFRQVASDQSDDIRRDFNLYQCLDGVVASLAPRVEQNGDRIELDCPHDLDLDSYPSALIQVLTQLSINALDHGFGSGASSRSGGTLSIDCRRRGDRVRITCSDDGAGMAPEVLSRLFDPFVTTQRGQGYVGLGLHIAYNLVTGTLGGRINCDSQPGKGTRFFIDLPLQAPQFGGSSASDSQRSSNVNG